MRKQIKDFKIGDMIIYNGSVCEIISTTGLEVVVWDLLYNTSIYVPRLIVVNKYIEENV